MPHDHTSEWRRTVLAGLTRRDLLRSATAIAGLAAVGTVLAPRSAEAAVALVISTQIAGSANGGTSSAVNTTGATLIVISIAQYSVSAAVTPTDNAGNTYVRAYAAVDPSNETSSLWYCVNPNTSASHQFTVAETSMFGGAQIAAFSGTALSAVLQTATGAFNASTSIQPGSVTPVQNNSLIVSGLAMNGSASTVPPPTGFTITSQFAASSGVTYGGALSYLIQTSATAENPTWSLSGASGLATTIAVFTTIPFYPQITPYAVWRVRTGGSNANGGGYDASILNAGIDYSQQDAAQWTSTSVTSSGVTCTDNNAQGTLTTAMIGNIVWMSGAAYTIQTVPTSNTFTTTTAPSVTAVAAAIGGAWADPWTNTAGSVAVVQPGNVVSIRGSGSMFPTVPDYTLGGGAVDTVPVVGTVTQGIVRFIGENGRPWLRSPGDGWKNALLNSFEFLKFDTTSVSGSAIFYGPISCQWLGCLFDQNGYDFPAILGCGNIIGCEFYSSHAPRGTQALYAVTTLRDGASVLFSNFHDTNGGGLYANSDGNLRGALVYGNIFSGCRGAGILSIPPVGGQLSLLRNTIDANIGNGISFSTESSLYSVMCGGNLITNHTQASTYGLAVTRAGATVASSNVSRGFCDANQFYGNTTNYLALAAGPDDAVLASNPYAAQSTEGYNPVAVAWNAGWPSTAFIQSLSGMTATQSYMTPGAVQP